MIPLLAEHKNAVAELCREFRIKKLDVFGSAATGDFDPDTSDIDFIVDLGDYANGEAWRFFDFADALEEVRGRRVDLLTDVQIRNPYLREAVEEQRVNVYDASNSQAAA